MTILCMVIDTDGPPGMFHKSQKQRKLKVLILMDLN